MLLRILPSRVILTDSPRSKRPVEPEPASNLYLWLAVGAGLNIIALALLIYMLVA